MSETTSSGTSPASPWCPARSCWRRSRSWRAGSRPRRASSRGGSCSITTSARYFGAALPGDRIDLVVTSVPTDDPERRVPGREHGRRRAAGARRVRRTRGGARRPRREGAGGARVRAAPAARPAVPRGRAPVRAALGTNAAVTGVGAITALGASVSATWDGLVDSRDGAHAGGGRGTGACRARRQSTSRGCARPFRVHEAQANSSTRPGSSP
jgi:hypothetical protein